MVYRWVVRPVATRNGRDEKLGLRQKVDRVRQLERPLRVTATEVALLIAHREQDGVASVGYLLALGCFEVGCARKRPAGRKKDDFIPLEPLLAQVLLRCFAEVRRPAGDEEHGHTQHLRSLVQIECWLESLGLRL